MRPCCTQACPFALPAVHCREQASAAKAVFKLMEEKFALLQPANLPSAAGAKPASAAAKQAAANLADLEGLIQSRLQVGCPVRMWA